MLFADTIQLAINHCHATPKMLRFLLRRELVRQFARFGGQTAAGRFFRVVGLLCCGAFWLSHNKLNLPLPAGGCKESLEFIEAQMVLPPRIERGLAALCLSSFRPMPLPKPLQDDVTPPATAPAPRPSACAGLAPNCAAS